MNKIKEILEKAIELNASDIHLTNKLKPVMRVDGELKIIEEFDENNPEKLNEYTKELLNNIEYEKYQSDLNYDSSFQHNNSRFRLHIYRQMKCDAIALRLIPTKIPTFIEMNLPIVLKKFTTLESGLVLITGVTGSGKSTTLAAIIDEINRNYKKHIITVEHPIEFVHEHKKSIINQREVGTDVLSFSDAVSAAMREDPDIVLVGELRDLETISNAITMAETGHLVFGTLHTRSVPETADRLIDVFPPNQQEQIRIQLANSIQGIVSQTLYPKIGGGRVASCEIMFQTEAIRNLIREHGNTNTIIDQMLMTSKKTGSQTKVQALAKLVSAKLLSRELAIEGLDESDLDSFNQMIISNRERS